MSSLADSHRYSLDGCPCVGDQDEDQYHFIASLGYGAKLSDLVAHRVRQDSLKDEALVASQQSVADCGRSICRFVSCEP